MLKAITLSVTSLLVIIGILMMCNILGASFNVNFSETFNILCSQELAFLLFKGFSFIPYLINMDPNPFGNFGSSSSNSGMQGGSPPPNPDGSPLLPHPDDSEQARMRRMRESFLESRYNSVVPRYNESLIRWDHNVRVSGALRGKAGLDSMVEDVNRCRITKEQAIRLAKIGLQNNLFTLKEVVLAFGTVEWEVNHDHDSLQAIKAAEQARANRRPMAGAGLDALMKVCVSRRNLPIMRSKDLDQVHSIFYTYTAQNLGYHENGKTYRHDWYKYLFFRYGYEDMKISMVAIGRSASEIKGSKLFLTQFEDAFVSRR